ncbi:ABC transporter permease [Bacillus ndiopicus]|uniref:ABC transporter permease n=1 Tax=Bacillus ndiopicus TaxID=1347368 RepID=UPI0005A97D53|nr:ABC transporter permease [Bacillus ndiopicus]
MLKLIKLEIKKFKLFNYYKGVLIANLGFIAFLSMIYFLERNDGNIPFENFEMAMNISSAAIRTTFIIFAAVLIVKLIIDEYKSKSIEIMFTYPIGRKKILTAKLMIVVAFTFIMVMSSTSLMAGLLYFAEAQFDIFPVELSFQDIVRNVYVNFFYALATAGLSLIPLLFGMRRKSAVATIVSAIFLATVTSTTSDNINLFSIIAIPVSLGVFGILIGYLAISKIEQVDVI